MVTVQRCGLLRCDGRSQRVSVKFDSPVPPILMDNFPCFPRGVSIFSFFSIQTQAQAVAATAVSARKEKSRVNHGEPRSMFALHFGTVELKLFDQTTKVEM